MESPSAAPRLLPAAFSRLFAAMVVFDVAFLVFTVLAAANNRLAIDDFAYLAKRNQFGVWGGAAWFWNHWTGRFASSLLIGGTGGIAVQNGGRLTVYTLLTFALMIAGLSFFLARVWQRFFDTPLGGVRALTAGVFFCGLLVLGTRSMGEVWFWLAGSATYAWPLGLLFFALGFLTPAAPRVPEIVGASLLFLLIPFFNDSLALLVLPFFVWQWGKHIRSGSPGIPLLRRVTAYPLFVPLLCCAAAWLFCSLAPGQKIRVAATGGLHFAVAPKMTLLSLVRGGGYLLLKHGHAFLLAFLVGGAVGSVLRNRPDFTLLSRQALIGQGRSLIVFVLVVALLTFTPSVLAYGFVVDRVYLFATIALVSASFLFGAVLWQSEITVLLPRRTELLPPIAVLLGAFLLFGYDAYSGRTMATYARAYDARFAYLQTLRGASPDAVNLPALPPSGPLYTAEILHNPHHWINDALRDALHLPRLIRLAGSGVDAFR